MSVVPVAAAIVAPLAGAWIEIDKIENGGLSITVAPLAGAWIEINERSYLFSKRGPSLPLRERGLKYVTKTYNQNHDVVAPLAGAWIEIVPYA